MLQVLGAALFAHQWQNHLVEMVVDNMSVVQVLNSRIPISCT